jgi:hypothetical protein
MDHRDFRNTALPRQTFLAEHEICSTHGGLLLGTLLAALPYALPWLKTSPRRLQCSPI